MEWLETDGLGGFANGTVTGIPMRRYHALLNAPYLNPVNRIALVNAVETFVEIDGVEFPLSTFHFGQENYHPGGVSYLKNFEIDPFPKWSFHCAGVDIIHQIFMSHGESKISLSWETDSKKKVKFRIRPFFSGRSYHSLHKENAAINLNETRDESGYSWRLYEGLPELYCYVNGEFTKNPLWFKDIHYNEDRLRGADFKEDWASPGNFNVNSKNAYLVFSTSKFDKKVTESSFLSARKSEEKRRRSFGSVLSKAADSYIIKRGDGKAIIAGYPWFADWGRDTFISMRGLCLANKRLEDAKNILQEWSKTIKDGLVPNRFVEAGEAPEYNSVDASLRFIISAYEYSKHDKKSAAYFRPHINSIIEAFFHGTKFNIKLDPDDGLLNAGEKGHQITWMDAKIGNFVVTPRIGKPVEIQALWLNALKIAIELGANYARIFETGVNSFNQKFWNAERNSLYDVIDCDYEKGKVDPAVRPNQLFSIGGLPFTILDKKYISAVMRTAEDELYTPPGIRTLSPKDAAYRGRYLGDGFQRDTSYHQGTVWPWLMGTFVESWLVSQGNSKAAKKEATQRFFKPFIAHLNTAGLGHLSEIHDGDSAHNSRGCPFQAWSVAEALRLEKAILS